jgi:molecular chaperone HtpG
LKGDKKESDLPEAIKDELKKIESDLSAKQNEKKSVYEEYSKTQNDVKQLVDLTLLSNNLLKGEALSQFIKRSYDMI